ncbi:hypothetical protein C7964_1011 [Loktanella sp. PT4BL]|uniref:calcium-binding protein n=1 Tax=Loktanella sp. PT4BL TaxID=2135611 RepID=UPI000D7707FC|nr:calcium-binding protein [Loktanella sp. PT4BL]PXW71896.1 hypothetical protein C7964_1011 [Loktanella sp. PT4BL]
MTNLTTAPVIPSPNMEVVATLSGGFFGAILVNNYGFHYFEDHVENLGLTNIRFPGGTVSEHGYIVDGRIRLGTDDVSLEALNGDRSNFAFDLTHPELISPLALEYDELHHLRRDDVGTFSQALNLAVQNGSSLALIIPVQRYFNNADFSDPEVRDQAVLAAISDISVFLERLKNGDYNDGVYPETITLEIGNEAYGNPIEYALIAKVMIDEIAAQLEGSGINYEIAFQMGRGSFEFISLLDSGYFDPFFDDSVDMIDGLEGLGFVPSQGMSYAERQVAIDEMMISVLGDSIEHIDALRHHYLMIDSNELANPELPVMQRDLILDHWLAQFSEYGLDPDDIDYYVSAWSTDSSNGSSSPYDPAAAINTLEVLSHFLTIGVDRAALWGVVGAFRYNDDMPSSVVTDRLSDYLSPKAALIKLMTENVMGADFMGEGGGASDGYKSYTFETETAFTVFFSVERLDGAEFSLNVDLGLFGDLSSVDVVNLDMLEGAQSGASNVTYSNTLVQNGSISLTFDQDFEIIMVTLEKEDSNSFGIAESIAEFLGEDVFWADDYEVLWATADGGSIIGSEMSDIVVGGAGDDIIDGGAGRTGVISSGRVDNFDQVGGQNGDLLFGGEGGDSIYGHSGNDLLFGGSGDDELWGGGGFDTFVFKEGNDQIHDFTLGVDTLLIDTTLLDGRQLTDFAQIDTTNQGNSIEFDFGNGNSLTIHGLTDLDSILTEVEFNEMEDLSF